jgi:four helix bundle protein
LQAHGRLSSRLLSSNRPAQSRRFIHRHQLRRGQRSLYEARPSNVFGIAQGSVQQCVPLLELARRRGLLKAEEHQILKANLEEIAKMLSGLISGLEKRDA